MSSKMFKSYEIVIGADVLAITVVVVAADVVVVVAFVFAIVVFIFVLFGVVVFVAVEFVSVVAAAVTDDHGEGVGVGDLLVVVDSSQLLSM